MKILGKEIQRKQLYIGIGVIAVLLVIVMGNSGSEEKEAASAGPPVEVQVAEVRRNTIEETVTAAGKIRPVFETEISSTISSQIMEILVDEGYAVRAGDTLVVLDRTRYEASYDQSRSALRSAKAGLRKSNAELDRGKQLFAKQLISKQEMEILEAEYERVKSQKEQADASVIRAMDDLEKTILRAPEDGVVTVMNKEVGEMALGSTFQADVILIIADLTMMEVVVEVDETDVVDIELMDLVRIEIDAIRGEEFNGTVSKIAHSAKIIGAGSQDQSTNFDVIITLEMKEMESSARGGGRFEARPIDPRIRPGMSATATITTARNENVVAVPIQAVTARIPIRKEVPKKDGEATDGEDHEGNRAAMTENRGNRGGGGGDTRQASAQGQRGGSGGGGPGGMMGRGGMGGGRQKSVEVVFVVVTDSAQSELGFIAKLFGAKKTETVEQREIVLGISSDTNFEVKSGLKSGETIVIGNYKAISKELKDGSHIIRKERGGGNSRGGGQRGGGPRMMRR